MEACGMRLLAAGAVAVTLQGCGGGGDSETTTTTTTTTRGYPLQPKFPRSKFMSEQETVDYLNKQINGYDSSDDKSPLGLTISMVSQPKTFFGNVFCSKMHNPVTETGCFRGGADCRWSTSLYNSKIWYDNTERAMMGLGREVGIVFNQTGVENEWNKCSYLWDGASAMKYNRGCGPGAQSTDCDSEYSAYQDFNPQTKERCKADDPLIQTEFCTAFGGHYDYPPSHDQGTQCVIPGTAIDWHDQNPADYKPRDNNLRTMVEERIRLNNGVDAKGQPNHVQWNEIVLDQTLLLPKLFEDPAFVVTAIIHAKSNAGTSYNDAMKLVNEFNKLAVMDGSTSVPLVMFDDVSSNPTDPVFVLSTPPSVDVNTMV